MKSHAFVRGTLTVSSNLPPHLRHGLFSSPGAAFTAVGRYSSESNHLQDDKLRGVRGFGLKVLGVSGARISGGDFGAQDLLFNNCRTSEVRWSYDKSEGHGTAALTRDDLGTCRRCTASTPPSRCSD